MKSMILGSFQKDGKERTMEFYEYYHVCDVYCRLKLFELLVFVYIHSQTEFDL